MLVTDKDTHIIAAEELVADSRAAVEAGEYERATALATLAQAHVAISRHTEAIEADTDVIEKLTAISDRLNA